MTQDEAFLQAIIDNPNDDNLRLVYAGHLHERGDPRGEFIRVQCELARLPEGDPRRGELEVKGRELLKENEEEWVKPLRQWATRWMFRRGFVEEIAVSPQVYLEQAVALRRLAPIRRIEIDFHQANISQDMLRHIPESVARENVILPLGLRRRTLVLAMRDPNDWDTLAKLNFILNRDIEPVPAPADQLIEVINRSYGETDVGSVFTTGFVEEDDPDLYDVEDDTSPVARLVNLIIQEALTLRATEIRIEPRGDCLHVGYRIDGKIVERDRPPRRLLDMILERVRFLSSTESG